jgi:hypothetical protein
MSSHDSKQQIERKIVLVCTSTDTHTGHVSDTMSPRRQVRQIQTMLQLRLGNSKVPDLKADLKAANILMNSAKLRC